MYFWDGSELIRYDDLVDRTKNGLADGKYWTEGLKTRSRQARDSDLGRYPSWYFDRAYGISEPSDIDEWETYVRRFCLIRKCDDRQKASAKAILDDCRKTAVPMLARITTEQAKEKDAAKRDAMLAPIADIFTRNLVPRLESLLATAQSQPTTRPVAGPSGAATKS